jgi:signal transduction histidine kinase
MAPALLAFTRAYPVPSSFPSSGVLRATFVVGGIFAILSMATPLIVYDVSVNDGALSRRAGTLYSAFSFYSLVVWGTAFTVFAKKWWGASGIARAQLQYLGVGLVLPLAGGVGTNLLLPLLTGRSTFSWIGPYFTLFFVTIVSHAIIRHRLMDIRLVVHRSLVHLIAMATISGLLIALGRLAWTEWNVAVVSIHADVLVIVIVTMALLTAPAQTFFHRWTDPYLWRGRIDHASALREATHRLSHLMQPAELSEQLRQVLTEAFVPESFSMAARPLEGGALEQLSVDTPGIADLLTIATLMSDQAQPSVLVVNPEGSGTRASAHSALRAAGIELVITLARRDRLLGAVLLGPRRSGDAYFGRDLAFIESVAELASIALENALLYRQSIQTLEYSERLVESLDSAVVAVDGIGRITSFNPAAKSLLGLNDSAAGLSLTVLPPEIAWALVFAISGEWRPRDVEVTIDHEGRGPLPIILSTAVLQDQLGKTAGALVVVTNLSAVKALERNQRRIEHFAMMARFYAGIAHEIRSPLAAISNFISMLPDRFDDPEYRDTAARLLPMEVARIVRLADRLRLMAPSEDGKLSVVALPPLLTDIVAIHAPAAEESGAKVLLDCPEDLPRILGDPGQLVQLFVNLLKNAIEAMPNGGVVLIKCSERSTTNAVVAEVIDDGIGVDPSIRTKVFQPFFTTKPLGTGLGLSICREIADFHRARLTLSPRTNNRGTTAKVEFSRLPDDDDPATMEQVGQTILSAKRQLRS